MNIQTRAAKTARYSVTGIIAGGLVASAIFFAGCSQTPILATIEGEEALKAASVVGHVYSLFVAAPADGTTKNVYLTNGYVFTRAAGSGSWTKIDMPSGTRCSFLATDKLDGTGSLYGFFVTTADWTVFDSVRKYDGTAWTTVTGLSSVSSIGSGNGIIYAFADDGTHAVDTTSAERTYNAYVTTAASATLGATPAFNPTALATGISTPVSTSGNYVATRAYNGGGYTSSVYYYSAGALTKLSFTGIPSTYITSVASDVNDNAYILASSSVYQITSTALVGTYSHSIGTPADHISILDTSGTDFILVSGSTGYCEIPGTVGGSWNSSSQTPGSASPSTIETVSKTNYTSSLKVYRVFGIWGIVDPAPSGDDWVMYASVADADYGGLWAYYNPATITTTPYWNRE